MDFAITGAVPRLVVDEVSDKHPINPRAPKRSAPTEAIRLVAVVLLVGSCSAGLGYHAAANLLRDHVAVEHASTGSTAAIQGEGP
jgi:hypothetical protein